MANLKKDNLLSKGPSGGERFSVCEDTSGVERMTGEVKSVKDKGYGFIKSEDFKEYFFHHSGFRGDWEQLFRDAQVGEKIYVEFEVDNSNPKGPRATNVERLDDR